VTVLVVAVGDDGDAHAVEWAAAEAAARRCALHVVHVIRARWAVDPFGIVPVQDLRVSAAAAQAVLDAAVTRARSVASDLEVSARLVVGSTVPSLLLQARDAELLVLGGHARCAGGRRGWFAVRVSEHVAARARCGVAVIRRWEGSPPDGTPPRVVVGVDGTASCSSALEFAFRAAAQRGIRVTAVHAWTPDLPADLEAVAGTVAGSEAIAHTVLEQALSPWRSRFIDVPVEARLVCGNPTRALIRESEGAALVVVGCRGRGSARARAFGSVSRAVTRDARCPAVVVRRGRAVQHEQPRSTAIARTEPVQRRSAPWE
jgi:nucleotide-binding universal stress UspA family protein